MEWLKVFSLSKYIMTTEANQIQDQLIWYQKAFPMPEETGETNTFDSIQYVYKAFDRMKAPQTQLFVCERQNECTCKGDCLCDSDQCYQVSSSDLVLGSNNMILFRFQFGEKAALSRMKSYRFFTLHDKTDEEVPVMDLMKVLCKRKKRKVVKEVNTVFPGLSPEVHFPVDGDPKVKENEIYFGFNYMLYE
jgi:hypothetical protein